MRSCCRDRTYRPAFDMSWFLFSHIIRRPTRTHYRAAWFDSTASGCIHWCPAEHIQQECKVQLIRSMQRNGLHTLGRGYQGQGETTTDVVWNPAVHDSNFWFTS